MLILIFEFFGTALIAALYNTSFAEDYDVGFFVTDYTGYLAGVYIAIVLSINISGSHYNPAITLAFMFRKDTGKFSRILGLAYILF